MIEETTRHEDLVRAFCKLHGLCMKLFNYNGEVFLKLSTLDGMHFVALEDLDCFYSRFEDEIFHGKTAEEACKRFLEGLVDQRLRVVLHHVDNASMRCCDGLHVKVKHSCLEELEIELSLRENLQREKEEKG